MTFLYIHIFLSQQGSQPEGSRRRAVAQAGRPQVRHRERHLRRVRDLVGVWREGLPLRTAQNGPLEPGTDGGKSATVKTALVSKIAWISQDPGYKHRL